MKSSDIPQKYAVPWASSAATGYRNAIQQTAAGAVASQALGFPPVTAVPLPAGGTPPNIADFNGALNYETLWSRWLQAGAPVGYDATFATNIGGYPRGAILPSSVTLGLRWLSTADNNLTNPDSGGVNWVSQGIASVGFTPVQQGGGTGQGANKVYLGWDSANVHPRIEIDTTDLGTLALTSDFVSQLALNGYIKLPGRLILTWQSQLLSRQQLQTVNFPIAFAQQVYFMVGGIGAYVTLTTNEAGVGCQPISLTQFQAAAPSDTIGTIGCYFFAIGR